MIFDSPYTFGICFLSAGVLFIQFLFVKPEPKPILLTQKTKEEKYA